VIGNLQHSGWYRINYDENNWKLLIDQLNTDHLLIDPVHRAQLLDDSFNLGRAEIIDQLVFLNINKYLVNEIDPLPFRPALNGLNTITPLIEDDFESFELYKVNLLFFSS
jgi:aminopeptidase N